MRETWGLFLILAGIAFVWVGIHGYKDSGAGLPGVMSAIYGALDKS